MYLNFNMQLGQKIKGEITNIIVKALGAKSGEEKQEQRPTEVFRRSSVKAKAFEFHPGSNGELSDSF